MSRGRKPELVTSGNVSALPLHEEPQAVHIAKAAELRPDDLKPAEIKVWDGLAPFLVMAGRLKPLFADTFAEYCRVRVRIAEARMTMDETSWTYVVEGRNGRQEKSKPAVAQLNDDWRKWRTLVGEFGLAPAAERGMRSGQGDLFDDFENF
jgi:phage terminase small subunit